jgi:hypothetical protein
MGISDFALSLSLVVSWVPFRSILRSCVKESKLQLYPAVKTTKQDMPNKALIQADSERSSGNGNIAFPLWVLPKAEE